MQTGIEKQLNKVGCGSSQGVTVHVRQSCERSVFFDDKIKKPERVY